MVVLKWMSLNETFEGIFSISIQNSFVLDQHNQLIWTHSILFFLFFSFNFLSIPFGWCNFIKIIFYTILIMWIICKKNVNLKQEIFWPFLIISQIKSKNHRIKFFLNSLFQVLSYKLCLPLWYFCAKICTNIHFTSILFIAFYHLIS